MEFSRNQDLHGKPVFFIFQLNIYTFSITKICENAIKEPRQTERHTDILKSFVCIFDSREKTQLHRNYNLLFEKRKRQFYLYVPIDL